MRLSLSILIFLLGLATVHSVEVVFGHEDPSKNMAKNFDFEDPISKNDWVEDRCSTEKSSNAHTGKSSLKIMKRTNRAGGVYQMYKVKPKAFYYHSIWFKLLENSTTYDIVDSFCSYMEGGAKRNLRLARVPYAFAEGFWQHVGGDVQIPAGVTEVKCFLMVHPQEVEYMVDTAAMTELEDHDDWDSYLDAKIAKNRQSDLTVKGRLRGGLDPGSTKIKVELTRHEFGFGTALKSRYFRLKDSTSLNYQNFILKHFNWAVFENDMKWKIIEKFKNSPNFKDVDNAIDILLQHNFTVRGHPLVWDIPESVPYFISKKTGVDMKNEVIRRITYMMEHYKGKVTEWDICNEFLHKHYFEESSHRMDMLEREFKTATAIDPKAKLCLNDYQCVRDGTLTAAQASLCRTLQKKNLPCGGIGIQSHMRILPVAKPALEKRIQISGTAGVPVTITELSFHSTDMKVRAQAVNDILKIYFADPNVHAALVWGFTELFGTFATDHYLTSGPNFKLNPAGQVMMDLIHKEWKTMKTITPSGSRISETFPAFHGNYKLSVISGDKVVHEQDFYVSKSGPNVVNLSM